MQPGAGCNAAAHEPPHSAAWHDGPELFPEAASRALLGLANKVGCVSLTVAEKGILPLEEDTGVGTLAGRREGLSSAPPVREGLICCRAVRSGAEQAFFPKVAKGNQGSPLAWYHVSWFPKYCCAWLRPACLLRSLRAANRFLRC